MKTYVFEGRSRDGNWGKFLVGVMDDEWHVASQVDAGRPLLRSIGWAPHHVWVMDLQTCEGAAFQLGGYPKADLEKHAIWVCPLFEPFLTWLYQQDPWRLYELPQVVELDAPLALAGHRRPGPSPATAAAAELRQLADQLLSKIETWREQHPGIYAKAQDGMHRAMVDARARADALDPQEATDAG